MSKTLFVTLALLLVLFGGKAFFAEQPDAPAEESLSPHALVAVDVAVEDREFIGADRCRTCHRKEEDGNQYGIWEASPHAQAFTVLASDEAKAIAAEKGIGDPQQAGECLTCHVTAFGVDDSLLGPKFLKEQGVSCESCHGAGGDYYKKATMEGISAGEIDAASVGLVVPTAEVCTTCHNEKSPTFKGFDFAEYSEKIAHPKP